ncbi:MAG: aminotransferase class IV [Lacibacter sp.]
MYNLNGKLHTEDESLIHPDNRAFRYGEGLFETIRLYKGEMPLFDLHWDRLIRSLPVLFFNQPPHFTKEYLKKALLQLAQRNNCFDAARVRIMIFKGEGGIWEKPTQAFHCLLQCWPIEQKEIRMNENGLDIGVFENGRKACDEISNCKTNNYLLYALAAQYAKAQKWNECIVLNQFNRVSDATIANIFFVKNKSIYTPALTEGCIAGVMRTYMLTSLPQNGFSIEEGVFTPEQLADADEIFFTNAMNGLRWVKQWNEKHFTPQLAPLIFQQIIKPLFS